MSVQVRKPRPALTTKPRIPSKTKKKLTRKQLILICAGAAVLCVLIVAGILLFGGSQPAAGTKVMNESNVKAIKEDIQAKVAEGMFSTYMNTTWVFADGGSASSNAVMGNSEANNYPFWFTVTLSDTQEVVFTSGTLPLGTQIDKVVLTKDLEKGTYPAVVNIHMINDKGEEVDSNMGFNIDIMIES